MLKNANVEEKLLENGKFFGAIDIIQSQHVLISDFHINKKVIQTGSGIPGFLTFTVWDPSVSFNWRKHEMKSGMIGVLWENEHHSVTSANFNGSPITVKEAFFKKACEAKGHFGLVDFLKVNECLHVSESLLQVLRNNIRYLIRNKNLETAYVHTVLEIKLIDLLVNILASAMPHRAIQKVKHKKFVDAIDYIHVHLEDLTAISQVSEQLNIPERTLRRLIQSNYQVSPKDYLNKLRLNAVRKGIKENAEHSIKEIASEYNFWHMGQFTRDYKKLFSELPSKTMNIK